MMNSNTASYFLRPGVVLATIAMVAVVVASNYLVQFPVQPEQVPAGLANGVTGIFGIPINELLTWGAFTYPIAFLVNDLTNRRLGTGAARIVVLVGFALAVLISIKVADWRIALASGSAFLAAQLFDTQLFHRLRHGAWWKAPVVSSTLASIIDTALFFSIAFVGTGLPWMTWALGDYGVKLLVALAMLVPFRALMIVTRPANALT